MNVVRILPATMGRADWLAEHLRDGDRAEIEAGAGTLDVRAIVRQSVAASMRAHAAVERRGVIAMWGIIPGEPDAPWLLTSHLAGDHKMRLMREARAFVDDWRGRAMANHVDPRYRQAVRLLDWLGFTIDPPAPWGPLGAPFCRFHRGASA